ncbi:MAG: hypothetical protein ABSB19_05935 [Methylomonas sp.]
MKTEHMNGESNFRPQFEVSHRDTRHRRVLAVSFQKTEATKKIKELIDMAFRVKKCDALHIYRKKPMFFQIFSSLLTIGPSKPLAIGVLKQSPFVRDFCSCSS